MEKSRIEVDKEELEFAFHNITSFRSGNHFKVATYNFIADKLLTQNEKYPISKIFKAFDIKGDGKISKEGFAIAYKNHFSK